jgi:hypothetical protein
MTPWAIGLTVAVLISDDAVLRAGTDVPSPKEIAHAPAVYPEVARNYLPMPRAIIVLDLGLDKEGKVVDIKVLRGIPLLDQLAIWAAKKWTYGPTLVDGIPRRVAVTEVVEMFPDERSRWDYFLELLKNQKEAAPYRLLALERLAGTTGKQLEKLQSTLSKLSKDEPNEMVRAAATQALAQPVKK